MTFAYFSILLFAFLNLFCSVAAKKAANMHAAENHNPREILARATGKAARLNAAQQNGYEMLPLYAAAIIIAHATGEAAQGTINFWATLFLLSRVAYIWAYAQDKATARSAIWGVGLICVIALFIAAF